MEYKRKMDGSTILPSLIAEALNIPCVTARLRLVLFTADGGQPYAKAMTDFLHGCGNNRTRIIEPDSLGHDCGDPRPDVCGVSTARAGIAILF